VVMIIAATFFPMSPVMFNEEKAMQARSGIW
jgi:hypothetical protein